MTGFIAALRELQRPLTALVVAILLLQTLVTGLATAHTAARIAIWGADAPLICHGIGDDGSTPAGPAADFDCCVFCTGHSPAPLVVEASVVARLLPSRRATRVVLPADVWASLRSIRAGPSRAPPVVA